MLRNVLKQIKTGLEKPLLGLGAVGFGTTLAACYGPPPSYSRAEAGHMQEYCETLLREGCEVSKIPAQSKGYCKNLITSACTDKSVQVPKCCADLFSGEDRINCD